MKSTNVKDPPKAENHKKSLKDENNTTTNEANEKREDTVEKIENKPKIQLDKNTLLRMLKKSKNDIKERYKFWSSQPVPKLDENFDDNINEPYNKDDKVENVRQVPYKLPSGYCWIECDIKNEKDKKEVFELLSNHYVEDSDSMFRFLYSPEFLEWALIAPNYLKEWHIGVHYEPTSKLVGFISAIPMNVNINGKVISMAEVNFLCVHKDLRSKRLAPVLIKEITRRVNLTDRWQAIYTAGVYLPKPVAEAVYYHRSLNIKKLIEVKFSSLNARLTMSRAIKLYRVREELFNPTLRKMEKKDVEIVHSLLKNYLKDFKIHVEFSKEEVEHWFLPRENVIYTYVNDINGEVKDIISFYSLPSQVLNHPKHSRLNAAYAFYNVATSADIKELMNDTFTLAKRENFDVYNILEIMNNKSFLEDLKFGEGDGSLKYYLYNWKCKTMKPSDIGIVFL